ncbi:hypothetical protein V496_03428 [Pseudogymnoascus sp. VKM F-4515 (FW-2607)]|nr:hypothetical protein V496_03428 [Pseudogymnoascus sp. VKM F-4515 (FW-2607)]KFY99889.1 hypothetical protein V498_00456 [Pseudogymnoascus sp. VKM F-4517 (FW-2822)]
MTFSFTDADRTDPVALQAARMVVFTILQLVDPHMASNASNFLFFYPDNCEYDIQTLDSVGSAMRTARFVYLDFEPMYNTVTAPNKASRTIQDSKRSEATYAADTGGGSSGAASDSRGQEIATMLHGEQSTGAGKQIQQQQP